MPDKTESARHAIELMGGVRAASKTLGLCYHAVYRWQTSGYGVPAHRCGAVAAATGGKVTVSELRPDLFPQSSTG